jgi:hypothetical protein
MSNYLPDEEHQRRLAIWKESKNNKEAAKKAGVADATFTKWRRTYNIPNHRINTKPKRAKKKIKQALGPFYRPSPDAHIFKRMLRERFMPTMESAIGLPGVVVRTKIRYVDRAI